MAGFVPVDTDFMTIKELEADGLWPVSWTAVLGLIPYIKRLGPNVKGIEVGVARAESSYCILKECPNVVRLYGIDPYLAFDDWNGHVDQVINDRTRSIAIQNMVEFGDRFYHFFKKSSEWTDPVYITPQVVDFVFIDGDHSLAGAKADMKLFYPMVRPGGLFSGHDYNLPEVRKALEEFREENKIRIPINLSKNHTWFWTTV